MKQGKVQQLVSLIILQTIENSWYLRIKLTSADMNTVAKLRQEKSLPPLEPIVIDVISSTNVKLDTEDAAELRNGKMSSTAIRQWIAGKQKAGDANEPAAVSQ